MNIVFKRLLFIIIFLFLFNSFSFGHSFWIVPDNFHLQKEGDINISICGGHHFPKPEVAIRRDLISKVFVNFENKIENLKITKKDKQWVSKYSVSKKGLYLLNFVIKKKQIKAPLFYGRSILFFIDQDNDKKTHIKIPVTGIGLEIIPQSCIWQPIKNKKMKFQILFKGKAVKTKVKMYEINNQNQVRTISNKTNKMGIVEFNSKTKGLYLLTTRFNKTGASLSFKL